ncbi:MAG TPA: ATP F0F1 synthase subunit B [Phenylobacterium sp.]|jgi:F-type H+-transporting ATPase subunit b|uniref:F0F1 ATP synthase subunit B family protein n=1 Tax=Phenylobacterium sp. TaxID=1871053 RepID=UPI002C9FBF5F|nr:ATP F0F1 synthase subunit B [Phenylobacterium sp.]HXA38372.1 ATP F0F1 synthase subunit B [Phenylobacterium sp.]
MELLTSAHFWVGVAFVVFVVILVFAGVHKFAWKALGDAGDKVRAQLDEANRLREEAQALLARIQSDREHSEKLAAEIMANAQEQAQRLQAEAQERLAEQIERRGQLAERRIATAEAQAAAEVKAAAGELAAEMAETVLAARIAGAKSDPLIDSAIGQLAGKLQ